MRSITILNAMNPREKLKHEDLDFKRFMGEVCQRHCASNEQCNTTKTMLLQT